MVWVGRDLIGHLVLTIWLIYAWRGKVLEIIQASWKDRTEWTSIIKQGAWQCRFKILFNGFHSRSMVDTFHYILLFFALGFKRALQYVRPSILLQKHKFRTVQTSDAQLFWEWKRMPSDLERKKKRGGGLFSSLFSKILQDSHTCF